MLTTVKFGGIFNKHSREGRKVRKQFDEEILQKSAWQTNFDMIICLSCRREARGRVPWKLNNVRTKQLMLNKHQKRVLKVRNDYKFFWELRKASKNDLSSFGWLNTILLRVWSWLRMNAGGVPNTCKSNGREELALRVSGGRVSNVWATCLSEGDNSWKRLLIPHNVPRGHPHGTKGAIRWKMGSYLIS